MTMDRAVFIKRYGDLYTDYHKRLEEYRVQAQLGSMEARDKKTKLVDDLQTKLKSARSSWEKLKDASNEQYRQLLADTEEAWHDITSGFKNAASHFQHEKDDKAGS